MTIIPDILSSANRVHENIGCTKCVFMRMLTWKMQLRAIECYFILSTLFS